MGRPSEYKPEYCDQVKDFMRLGYSRMAAAGHIGVCYNTFRAWQAQYPGFMQAVNEGSAARLVFLETGLLEAASGPQVTSRIFALKNAAPEEWRDRVTVQGDRDADAVQVEHKGEGLTALAALVDSIAIKAGTSGEPSGE